MIISTIDSIYKQIPNSLYLTEGISYLKSITEENFKCGSFPIDAKHVFASHSEYLTKSHDDKSFILGEAHKKYIDIQFLLTGNEKIGFAPLQNNQNYLSHDEDCYMYSCLKDEITFFSLKSSEKLVMILFPSDIHFPQFECEKIEKVKKIVVKIEY